MGIKYKSVELTQKERKNKSFSERAVLACSKCIATKDDVLCGCLCITFNDCSDSPSSYFIEVEKDDK